MKAQGIFSQDGLRKLVKSKAVFSGDGGLKVLKWLLIVLLVVAPATALSAGAEDSSPPPLVSGFSGAKGVVDLREEETYWRAAFNKTLSEWAFQGSGRSIVLAEDLAPTGDHETMGAEEVLEFADEFEEEILLIADPIEPFNRGTFYINDKLYFWIFRPISVGYGFVVPEKARVGVRRFFTNLAMPMRFVNDVLQFKFKYAGIEMARFVINTTVGVAGFSDPAEKWFHLYLHKEDFGQTLGFYGLGPGVYINWPLFGPSSIRDTVGMVGDLFLNPLTYLFPEDRAVSAGIDIYGRVNETSLNIGIYEHIKRDSLDPYVFIRNAYHQHRENAVKE
ncbi:MAG: VacJ family lipoprotein [Thermodesulfobacteriota bacterium]